MRLAKLRMILPGEMPRTFLHVSGIPRFPACFAPLSSLVMHAETDIRAPEARGHGGSMASMEVGARHAAARGKSVAHAAA
jgi:hypothetical protein